MGLSRGQQEAQRIAEGIDQSMDFGVQSALLRPIARSSSFLGRRRCAGGRARWCCQFIAYSFVGLGGEVLEEALPHPFLGPAAEPLVGVLPVAKPFWQVAPRNCGAVAVEHRFDELTIVVGGDAHITGFAGQQVSDSLPLVIAKCISVRGSALFQADFP